MRTHINDNYIKVRKVNGQYVAVHLFTDKILYNPKTKYKNPGMSKGSLKNVQIALEYLERVEKSLTEVCEKLPKLNIRK